jgi:hypothetical protein
LANTDKPFFMLRVFRITEGDEIRITEDGRRLNKRYPMFPGIRFRFAIIPFKDEAHTGRSSHIVCTQ